MGWRGFATLAGSIALVMFLGILIGSLFGGFLFSKLGVRIVPDFWGELITATIGAVVFLALWQAIRRA